MANSAALARKIDRAESIMGTLRANPGKEVSIDEIMRYYNVCRNTALSTVNFIIGQDSNFVRAKGSNLSYVGKIQPAYERYSPAKTNEGYNDPTAAAVIRKEEKVVNFESEVKPKPGDVWKVKCQVGADELYVVLAVNEEEAYATCIKYVPKEKNFADYENSAKKLFSKPIKYFIEKTWGIPLSELTKIKGMVGAYLGIESVERVVEVEKIVTKEIPVEVPVAVASDDSGKIYSQEDMDLALLKQKAEIYETCFLAMATR